MVLSQNSLNKLKGVAPKLVQLVLYANKNGKIPFVVVQGVRTEQEQIACFKTGKSKCDGIIKKSNHQIKSDGFGHAVDLAPLENGKINWNNSKLFKDLDTELQAFAKNLGIKIRWGGTFTTIVDLDHWELV